MVLLLLGALAGGGYAAVLPDRYEAYSTVQIADPGTMERQIELMRSRATAQRVLDELKLHDDPEFAEQGLPFRIGWVGLRRFVERVEHRFRGNFGSGNPGISTSVESDVTGRETSIDAFRRRLHVRQIRSSPLVEIGFASSSHVKAARIANAVAVDHVGSQARARGRLGQATEGMFDEKLEALRRRVVEAEGEIERFKRESGMLDEDGRPLDASTLARETDRTDIARRKATHARERYETARRMMLNSDVSGDSAQASEYPSIRRLREVYFNALRREADLSTRYGRRHPEMEKAEAEIARAQHELTAEIGRVIGSLEVERENAESKLKEQERRLDHVRERITATKDKQAQVSMLESKASASRAAYQAMLDRARQADEILKLRAGVPRIVAVAEVPVAPSGPNRWLITATGLGIGLVLGLVLALPLEVQRRRRRLMTDKDAGRWLGVPLLASIPELSGSGELAAIRQMIAAPNGDFARSIAELGRMLENRQSDRGSRVVLFGSAMEGAGASFIAANLALHHALTGRRTLLIDCDRERARISAALGAAGGCGLVDHVAGPARAGSAILKDRMTGLHLMPAGRRRARTGNCRKALSRERFRRALAALRERYDIIILDSPDLLTGVDRRSLAEAADQIVLITDSGGVPVEATRRLMRGLGRRAVKVAGVVLDHTESDQHGRNLSDKVHKLHPGRTGAQQAPRTAAA